eukprot:8282471-Heterocapsa_arctica.AAC.1
MRLDLLTTTRIVTNAEPIRSLVSAHITYTLLLSQPVSQQRVSPHRGSTYDSWLQKPRLITTSGQERPTHTGVHNNNIHHRQQIAHSSGMLIN